MFTNEEGHTAYPFEGFDKGVFIVRLETGILLFDVADFRLGLGLPRFVKIVNRGGVEGRTQAEPPVGAIDKPDPYVASQCVATDAFLETPLVKISVGAFNFALLKFFFSCSFGVVEAGAETDVEAVSIVVTTGKGPFFGTSSKHPFLTLPDVALGYRAAVIQTLFVMK